jgi:hypothetical protein
VGGKLQISKTDAAARQLDLAIKLWFYEEDPVSIHTLMWAAYEIISDLCKKKGKPEMTAIELMKRRIKPEHLEEAMAIFKKAMTFFKHANRDAHTILEFNPESNDYLLLIAVGAFESLGERLSDIQRAYGNWCFMHMPHLLKDGENPLLNFVSVENLENIRKMSKRDYFQTFLNASALARGRL